jgi:hypothetical protein
VRTDRARIVDQLASISYVGVLPEAERGDLLARADAILARHGVGDVSVPVRTAVWTARRL